MSQEDTKQGKTDSKEGGWGEPSNQPHFHESVGAETECRKELNFEAAPSLANPSEPKLGGVAENLLVV